jgi:hypothetical protein
VDPWAPRALDAVSVRWRAVIGDDIEVIVFVAVTIGDGVLGGRSIGSIDKRLIQEKKTDSCFMYSVEKSTIINYTSFVSIYINL